MTLKMNDHASPQPEKLSRTRTIGFVSAVIVSVLMWPLAYTIVTPALPAFGEQFHLSTVATSLVYTLFLLTSAVAGVVLARWGDFIGRKRAVFIILAIATIGSLLCVFAVDPWMLFLGRALQGAGAGAYTLAYVVLGAHLRPKAFGLSVGVLTAFVVLVYGFGAYWGGLLLGAFGIPSLFVLLVVFGVVAIIAAWAGIPRDTAPQADEKMDWRGSAVLSIGLAGIVLYLAEGPVSGWFAPLALTYLGLFATFIVAFWFIEKRVKTPLISPKHLRSRQVWPLVATTTLAVASATAAMFYVVVLLSQDMEIGFELDPATSALIFVVPASLLGGAIAPFCGWLAVRVGWTRTLRVGLIVSTIAMAIMAIAPTVYGLVLGSILVLGIFYTGLINTTLAGLQVHLSPSDEPGALPSINSISFAIGGSIGVGVVAPFIGVGPAGGYVFSFAVCGLLILLALVASLFIKTEDGRVL